MLTTGEAPEDLRQIFKQRSRWCTGCFLTPTPTLTLILTLALALILTLTLTLTPTLILTRCTGCFQVFFQVETFMWVRQLPAIQMLCYFNSIMGYLSTVRSSISN